jgi:hypothetical protein
MEPSSGIFTETGTVKMVRLLNGQTETKHGGSTGKKSTLNKSSIFGYPVGYSVITMKKQTN